MSGDNNLRSDEDSDVIVDNDVNGTDTAIVPIDIKSTYPLTKRGEKDFDTIMNALYRTQQKSGDPSSSNILYNMYIRDMADEIEKISKVLDHNHAMRIAERAFKIGAEVTNYIDTYCGYGDSAKPSLGLLAQTVSGMMTNHPHTFNSDSLQDTIHAAFAKVADMSGILATEYHLGRDPVLVSGDKSANDFIGEYFERMPFKADINELATQTSPVDVILNDWYNAVKYCGALCDVPDDAFLRDGTPLFRFAPNTLEYVEENIEYFPGINMEKVNDGGYVEEWLKHTPIISKNKIESGETGTTLDKWLVLLTGYVPEDNEMIPQLYDRYNEVLVSTAISYQNKHI